MVHCPSLDINKRLVYDIVKGLQSDSFFGTTLSTSTAKRPFSHIMKVVGYDGPVLSILNIFHYSSVFFYNTTHSSPVFFTHSWWSVYLSYKFNNFTLIKSCTFFIRTDKEGQTTIPVDYVHLPFIPRTSNYPRRISDIDKLNLFSERLRGLVT